MKPKSLVVAVTGILSLLYLINPGAGVIELIPDNFPILGNLDEAAAATLLVAALAYFGLDLTRIFRDPDKDKAARRRGPEVVDAESRIVDDIR